MNLLHFFQSLGLAEYLITIALILITVYGCYDSMKEDREHKANVKRFDENYNR